MRQLNSGEAERGGECVEQIKSGYEYSSHLNQDGIEMDITIKTTREMAMSDLFGRYAALSHGVYLEMAKDVSSLTSQTTEEDMELLITEYIDVVREQMKKPNVSLVTINDSIRLLERHIHNVKIGAIRISQMED